LIGVVPWTLVRSRRFQQSPDVAATHRVLDSLDGTAVLVGHSYGGVVITEAGTHPNVVALAYIAAFAPDKGESVNSLIADPPPGAPVPPILPPREGFLFLDRAKFAASFAADVPSKLAAFMADSQVPWGVDALGGAATEPAWRIKPSWYLVATDDHMIPPPAHRHRDPREPRRLRVQPRRRGRVGKTALPDYLAGRASDTVCRVSRRLAITSVQVTTNHPSK
jgi:pimeloyl-ACP methyl ester carboxylesterase